MSKPNLLRSMQIPPIQVQGYERYLPTAFNDSMTMLQKVNKVIEYLYQYSDVTIEMLTKWNEVYGWVMNQGLSEAVLDKLNEWMEDGTLEKVINEGIFVDLNKKIDTMINDVSKLQRETAESIGIIQGESFISLTPYNLIGNGTSNDTTAFNNLESKNSGKFVDLGGRTYAVDFLPEKNYYMNGAFLVGGQRYVSPYGVMKVSDSNVFAGKDAGKNTKLYSIFLQGRGYANVGIGGESLQNNVDGWRNTVVGFQAMKDSVASAYNVAFGDSALEHTKGGPDSEGGLDLGSRNTALGSYALRYNKIGIGNVGVGRNSGHANETGNYNTAVGTNAYSGSIQNGNNTNPKSAHFNNAFGYRSLFWTENGSDNTAMGKDAGYMNVSGRFNSLLGNSAMRHNVKGNRNVANGYSALLSALEGSDNTAIGTESLSFATTVNSSTALGDNALRYDLAGNPLTSGDHMIGIGKQSRVSGDHQLQLGTSGITSYSYGAVQQRSDRRDKADIKETDLGLDFINKIEPVSYKWDYRDDYTEFYENWLGETQVRNLPKDGSKKRKRNHQGVIAQQVQEVCREMGVDFAGLQHHSVNDGNDVYSIGYDEFIGPLIKSVQELSSQLNVALKKIEVLESQ